MDLEMIFFEIAPLCALLILVGGAVRKIKKRHLPFQFFISDIWVVTLCLIPAVWCIANAIIHPTDPQNVFLALLIPPCQVLGVVLARLNHTICLKENRSWLSIVGGSLAGLAVAGASYAGSGIYGLFVHGFC